MAAYDALLVQKIEATLTTDDGQHMLLKLGMAPEGELTLAIPRAEIGALVELAALGLTRGEGGKKAAPGKPRLRSLGGSWQ